MKKILCILLCLLGCTSEKAERKVLVSIPPYAGIVREMVGETVTVEVVVPPGANPHIYEPTPEQMKHFSRAQVWFRTGEGIEKKMVRALEARGVKVVNVSGHEGDCCGEDLHLWMDPVLMAEQVEEMGQWLEEVFPEVAERVKRESKKIACRLREQDGELTKRLEPFQGRYLLVSHPALGHFCKQYGLHQLSVEVDGKDPLPQEVVRLMEKLEKHPVPVVFIEPQHNNKGAFLIGQKLGIPTEEIDPYAEDYFGILNRISQLIVDYYDHSDF